MTLGGPEACVIFIGPDALSLGSHLQSRGFSQLINSLCQLDICHVDGCCRLRACLKKLSIFHFLYFPQNSDVNEQLVHNR